MDICHPRFCHVILLCTEGSWRALHAALLHWGPGPLGQPHERELSLGWRFCSGAPLIRSGTRFPLPRAVEGQNGAEGARSALCARTQGTSGAWDGPGGAAPVPPSAAALRAQRGAERGPAGLPHGRAGGGSQTRAECDTYLPAPGAPRPRPALRGAARPRAPPGPPQPGGSGAESRRGQRGKGKGPRPPPPHREPLPGKSAAPAAAAAPLLQRRGLNLAENRTH
ncbi:collagen alpha-1(I) chain [Parus major]|uniref:collagen alpha-1(I) chain n=1 Tax=Parus major TaxID=9157 RepID=UPI001443F29B|nr:collagen alpha-1(I) chain [Parus major]